MKNSLLSISFLLFTTFSSYHIFSGNYYSEPISNTVDTVTTAKLSFVGDIMCHSVQYQYAQVGKDSFDFTPVYRYVKKYFEESDFILGNLETVTAGKSKKYSGYPFFNSPNQFASDLKKVGFDFLFTSNNHSLDRGEFGITKTLENLIASNLHYTGTHTNQVDRDSVRIININGIDFAFLSYSYGTNGNPIPKGKSYLINLIDEELIEKDIQSAKGKNADCIIVYFHFGEEYQREPNSFQKNIVQKTIGFGADMIIGSHPHVIQPIQIFPSLGKIDSVLVAYSLGNFISNQRWRYSDAGVILRVEVSKNILTDSVYLAKVEFIPTYVFKGNTENGKEYIIFPSQIVRSEFIPTFFNLEDRKNTSISFEDTYSIMRKYSERAKVKKLF
jgi:poly-gamma-glutamate capsule biosynthesis protein CapA/YwtB (metallophosphatase superfamily)